MRPFASLEGDKREADEREAQGTSRVLKVTGRVLRVKAGDFLVTPMSLKEYASRWFSLDLDYQFHLDRNAHGEAAHAHR